MFTIQHLLDGPHGILQSVEALAIVAIAGALGIASTVLRLVRVYGEEFLEFGKWLKAFLVEVRKLKG